jgi:hypothetical protein
VWQDTDEGEGEDSDQSVPFKSTGVGFSPDQSKKTANERGKLLTDKSDNYSSSADQ